MDFLPHARDLIQIHHPSIFIFFKKKVRDDNAALVAKKIAF